MNIDNKFRAACFHAYSQSQAKVKRGGIVNIDSVHKTYCHISDPDARDAGQVIGYDYLQLLLTPLSAVSDEDAVEVAKIVYSNPSLHTAERGRHVATNGAWHNTTNGVSFIDYLRSKSYDLGFQHIPSLIEAGLAIDNTKTKTDVRL